MREGSLALLEALATVVQDVPAAVQGIRTMIQTVEHDTLPVTADQERSMFEGAAAIHQANRPADRPEQPPTEAEELGAPTRRQAQQEPPV
jgi:hypothetical protein